MSLSIVPDSPLDSRPEQKSQESSRKPARAASVNRAIVAAEQALRQQFPILAHQDAIGVGLWLAALLLFGLTVLALLTGTLPPWLTIPLAALPLSILHELEHDLIHDLYFKPHPRLQNLLFTGIWLCKASMNPWSRGEIHLRHHRLSGQPGDVEERLIGLGVKNLPLRLLIAFLPAAGVVLLPGIRRDAPDWKVIHGKFFSGARQIQRLDLIFFGLPVILPVLWHFDVPLARELYLAWIAPNVLRHGCIVLMSSYSHYYEIPRNDVFHQNQILRHPLLLPFQVFCMAFGATHIIHHYVVTQPFYLRHMLRHEGWAALEAVGTPVNDWGIVKRANRLPLEDAVTSAEAAA